MNDRTDGKYVLDVKLTKIGIHFILFSLESDLIFSCSPRVRGARIMTVGPSRGWNSTFFYVIHLTNPDLHRILTLDWTGFHQPRGEN